MSLHLLHTVAPTHRPPGSKVPAPPIRTRPCRDVVLVRSGARVPAHGEIIDGTAELDESMITGESKPVAKDVGDRMVPGTVSSSARTAPADSRRRGALSWLPPSQVHHRPTTHATGHSVNISADDAAGGVGTTPRATKAALTPPLTGCGPTFGRCRLRAAPGRPDPQVSAPTALRSSPGSSAASR